MVSVRSGGADQKKKKKKKKKNKEKKQKATVIVLVRYFKRRPITFEQNPIREICEMVC